MLTHIDIRNLVAIQTAQLGFTAGTTAITGETGTGKSILIDAIGLALGDRVSGHPVRPGADRADITLTFDIRSLPAAAEWLMAHDFDKADEECIIRRVLTPDGRSRSYVNGIPLPLSRLRELSGKLIHIHGQHQQQALLDAKAQLTLLDSFAGTLPLAEKASACALAWRTLQTEITSLKAEIEKDRAHAEFLQFQLEELQALQIAPDEFQTLDLLQRQLGHADTSLAQLHQAIEFLSGGDQSIAPYIKQLTRITTSLQPVFPEAAQWLQTLDSITIQLNDLENSLQHAADQTRQDPEKRAAVEERLGVLFDIARKHRVPPEQLFPFQQQLARQCQEQKNGEKHLAALIAEAATIEKQYKEITETLSARRKEAAESLEQNIIRLFQPLALSHAHFSILLEATTGPLPASGLEQAIFCIRTSPDQPMLPLATIASGGELSRISLALHIASARQHATPTLIFDEVDTGIGGGTAETIGKLLRQLGDTHQVFCVTHTPQVAAQSHHHVRVRKEITDETACIHIEKLSPEESVKEIARMLGGLEMTRKTLAHAAEMTEKARTATRTTGVLP